MAFGDDLLDLFTGGKSSEANNYIQNALGQYDDLQAPSPDDLRSIIQGYVSAGQLSPQAAQAFLANPSALTSISTDPALKDAQNNALQSLQQIGQGGLTTQDKADLSQIATNEGTQARGARDAIIQNAAAHGAADNGLSLLNQMKANQDAASNQSQRDLNISGGAQQRALQALQAAGQQAGGMQAQEFGQKAAIANAQDAISRFNAGQQQQTGLYNTGTANQAQAQNLGNAQDIANSRVNAANANSTNTAAANQQSFNDRLTKSNANAGVLGAAAGNATQQGQGIENLIGTGITGASYAYGKPPVPATASDKNLKENVEDFDPGKFLDSITGYKYDYKQGMNLPKEKQVGVMAQDVEKEAPQMVKNGSLGKMIDYNKAGGPIMASLANLHHRLKKMEG